MLSEIEQNTVYKNSIAANAMNSLLDQLMGKGQIWQATQSLRPGAQAQSTGYSELDACVGGGWPRGALTELLLPMTGIGELRLCLPALRQASQSGKAVFWFDPPHIPYAPALARAGVLLSHLFVIRSKQRKDQLWGMDQALRSQACGLILAWPDHPRPGDLRRLQLAAAESDGLAILMRADRDSHQTSPSALRLQLRPHPEGLDVTVLKRRGGWGGMTRTLRLPAPVTPQQRGAHAVEPASNQRIIQGPWPEQDDREQQYDRM